MGDPFSVTASAAGVISLGLQASQALVAYYHAFEAYDQDVAQVLGHLDSLKHTLQCLDEVLSRNSIVASSTSVVLNVCGHVLACEEGLKRLKVWADKTKPPEASVGFQDKARRFKQRSLHYFRKDALENVTDTVRSLQHGLSLALQVLSL